MILMAASCPSNRLAAVTSLILLLGWYACVSCIYYKFLLIVKKVRPSDFLAERERKGKQKLAAMVTENPNFGAFRVVLPTKIRLNSAA
jgi:hypothetical protein